MLTPILRFCFGLLVASAGLTEALAARNDWAEGTPGQPNGASRDYYNRAGLLKWDHRLGDWRDAKNVAQGDAAYATATLSDDDTARFVQWDVTNLVRQWVQRKFQNQGMFLRGIEGQGSYHFRSRQYSEPGRRPRLVITTPDGTMTLTPEADTYLDPSTYRSLGDSDTLKVTINSNHALLRFDLGKIAQGTQIAEALLRLYTHAQYGGGTMVAGVFRCRQGHELPEKPPVLGLASKYPGDRSIATDTDVVFATGFESKDWSDEWTYVGGSLEALDGDPDRGFKPFQGKALRVKIAKGSTGAMNVTYKFQKETGREPEEIYLRYYLRFANDWRQTLQGGKMPGISGTYGVAGWGGRRSDGTNGWSARGSFYYSIPEDNPLAGTTPIGTYCYHADQQGPYGEIWLWQNGYRGFLENNRWYCVEQHLKLNTPGIKDGTIRAWIDGRPAFEKTDIRFRKTEKLRIEQVWMNVYHGGTKPSPYDQHLFIDNVVIARKYIGPMTVGSNGRTPSVPPSKP